MSEPKQGAAPEVREGQRCNWIAGVGNCSCDPHNPNHTFITQPSAGLASAPTELWEVVEGDEADHWGIRKAGEKSGMSIAQMMWEHDAKEVVRLHNRAAAPSAGDAPAPVNITEGIIKDIERKDRRATGAEVAQIIAYKSGQPPSNDAEAGGDAELEQRAREWFRTAPEVTEIITSKRWGTTGGPIDPGYNATDVIALAAAFTRDYTAGLRQRLEHLQNFPPALADVIDRAEAAERQLAEKEAAWVKAARQVGIAARRDALRKSVGIVRTTHVMHGDHYASYSAPSTDAEDLAKAIEARAAELEKE